MPEYEKCLVAGCPNTRDQGVFEGDLCMPCHIMITQGKIVSPGVTFIHDMADRLKELADQLAASEYYTYHYCGDRDD